MPVIYEKSSDVGQYAVEFTQTVLVDAESAGEAVEKAQGLRDSLVSTVYVDGNWWM